MIPDGVEELARYIKEHGLPEHVLEEVPLPDGMNIVTKAVRVPVIWNIKVGEDYEKSKVDLLQVVR